MMSSSFTGPQGEITVTECHTIKDAVHHTTMQNGKAKLTLVHTKVKDGKRSKRLKRLDQYIKEIYDTVAVNGLMIVVCAGTDQPLQNGFSLVRINQKQVDLTGLETLRRPGTTYVHR